MKKILLGLLLVSSIFAFADVQHYETKASVFYLDHVNEMQIHLSGIGAKEMYQKGKEVNGESPLNSVGHLKTYYGPFACTLSSYDEYGCHIAVYDSNI